MGFDSLSKFKPGMRGTLLYNGSRYRVEIVKGKVVDNKEILDLIHQGQRQDVPFGVSAYEGFELD